LNITPVNLRHDDDSFFNAESKYIFVCFSVPADINHVVGAALLIFCNTVEKTKVKQK
jgi:hypothetical protein